MSINQDNHCVIIAGATGLVGSRLLQHILQHDAIGTVYALSRRPPKVAHTGNDKVHLLLDPELKITAWMRVYQGPPSVLSAWAARENRLAAEQNCGR